MRQAEIANIYLVNDPSSRVVTRRLLRPTIARLASHYRQHDRDDVRRVGIRSEANVSGRRVLRLRRLSIGDRLPNTSTFSGFAPASDGVSGVQTGPEGHAFNPNRRVSEIECERFRQSV